MTDLDNSRSQGQVNTGLPTPPATTKGVRFNDNVDITTVTHDEHAEEGKARAKDQDYYFSFYSSLQNQANMMGDVWRTTAYKRAIEGNADVAIRGKTVLDVGAGSGILSYFAAGAGAKHVVALEASSMAEKISIIVDKANKGHSNPHLKDKIRVVRGMVEDSTVQDTVLRTGKVDTIINVFLKDGGTLLPSSGDLFFAPFEDKGLFDETDAKADFVRFVRAIAMLIPGTDFSDLYESARKEVFAQPVVGQFPPQSLMSAANTPKHIDFYTCTPESIKEFTYPLSFTVERTGLIHGIASWFDLAFDSPNPKASDEEEMSVNDQRLMEEWRAVERGQVDATSPFSPLHAFQMNPLPYPQPPSVGLNVKLSTGPMGTSLFGGENDTDAQRRAHIGSMLKRKGRSDDRQARLLLPEPLAVNRGEMVTGTIHFKVNDARSYDLTLKLALGRNDLLERKAEINLAQQCFNYSYTGEQAAVPYGA